MQLRISYSLLKTFETGTVSDVVDLYLRLNQRVTPQMERGSRFDEMTRRHIKEYKCLPLVLGGKQLNNPISDKDKLKFTVPFQDYVLSAEFDTLDGSAIYEFKDSSSKDSAEYTNDYQLDFYFLVANLLHLNVDRAYLFRHDPVFPNRYDHSLVWNSRSRVNNAVSKIEELAPKIKQLLIENLE